MKHHLLSTGNKQLAEATLLDPVWDIGPREDDPLAKTHVSGDETICSVSRFLPFAKQFATVRPG